jgi:hypothetical protein
MTALLLDIKSSNAVIASSCAVVVASFALIVSSFLSSFQGSLWCHHFKHRFHRSNLLFYRYAFILSAAAPHFCNPPAFNACNRWPTVKALRVVRPPVAPVWGWRVCFYRLINFYQLHPPPPGGIGTSLS